MALTIEMNHRLTTYISDAFFIFFPGDPFESISVSPSGSENDLLPFEVDEHHSTPVSNSLEKLTGPVSATTSTDAQRSFLPFANQGNKPKGQTSSSDILYKSPPKSSFLSCELPSAKSSLLSDMLLSDVERDSTPVSNYLERLVIPLGDASSYVKRSFSPFGDGGKKLKGQASGSDILYKPPAESSFVSNELPSYEERDSTPVSNDIDSNILPPTVKSTGIENSPYGMSSSEWMSSSSRADISDSSSFLSDGYEMTQKESEADMLDPSIKYREENVASTYLTSISGIEPPLKSSYSPYGLLQSEKFESSISGLYTTAQPLDRIDQMQSSYERSDFEIETTDNRSPSTSSFDDGYESYFDRLGRAIPFLKNAFSPFGSYSESKLSDGSIHTLYGRPQSMPREERSNIVSTSVEEKQIICGGDSNQSQQMAIGSDFDSGHESSTIENEDEINFDCFSKSSAPTSLPKTLDSLPHIEPQHQLIENTSEVKESSIPNFSPDEDEVIRAAYSEWCTNFGKESSDFRFEIFSAHYMVVQKFHDENGTPLMLNEFCDLTEEEYRTMVNEVGEDGTIDQSIDE